ncbi:branched-chain amino acid ABC transporter permease, partial [Pseudophaeobacter arcticus]
MDLSFVILIEMLYAVSSLILISAGLAVVFGMMKVINLAHGEFMMMGGYATITAVNLGVNIFVAMLVIAPLTVGLIGLIVERLVIRHLYGRLVDTMLATWGLSLFFIGLATMIFGNTTTGISTPIPGFTVGNYQINGYNFFIIVVSVLLLIAMRVVLKSTRAGLIARGAMQQADMAAALGYSPNRIYMATFFCGSALSGLAGAVLAP